ncbi:hypothetical protein ACLOJK_019521 [Asimina triloba]
MGVCPARTLEPKGGGLHLLWGLYGWQPQMGKTVRTVMVLSGQYLSNVTNVNVEDYLVDSEANMVGAGPHFGQTGGNDNAANTVPNESTQPVSPGGVSFSTPSTANPRPTMSSTSMPSSSQFPGVVFFSFEFSTLQYFIESQSSSLSTRIDTMETSLFRSSNVS